MAAPSVSIVLPVYNRLHFLREAVASVFAQTHSDWELIVADDGSDEATQAYLRELGQQPRVTVLWLQHSGNPGTARNAALAAARGEYVAFLDSDDLWHPEKLATQLPALKAAGPRRWCYTAYGLIDETGNAMAGHRGSGAPPGFENFLHMRSYVAMPTVLAERSLLTEAGGFDAGQVQHGDYELWLRLILLSDALVLDSSLASVRNHRQHYTRGGAWALRWKRRMYEKLLTLVRKPEERKAIRAALALNAGWLMRAHVAQRESSEAARVFKQSVAYGWWRPRWWASALSCLFIRDSEGAAPRTR